MLTNFREVALRTVACIICFGLVHLAQINGCLITPRYASAEQSAVKLQVAYDQVKNAPSRGALTTDFLKGNAQPLQYLEGLDAEV